MPKAKPEAKTDDLNLDPRGQIALTLEGEEYVLRPSHEAISNCEQLLRRSLYEMAGQATRVQLTMLEMGIICAEMMHAHAKVVGESDPKYAVYRSVKPERLSEMIMESSMPVVSAKLTVLLMGALTGHYNAAGEVKATS